MKNILILCFLMIFSFCFSQQEKRNDSINQPLLDLVETQTAKYERELVLTEEKTKRLKRIIYVYSDKADKVIQSELPQNEKTRELKNIIYKQDQELKNLFSVKEYYGFLRLTASN